MYEFQHDHQQAKDRQVATNLSDGLSDRLGNYGDHLIGVLGLVDVEHCLPVVGIRWLFIGFYGVLLHREVLLKFEVWINLEHRVCLV